MTPGTVPLLSYHFTIEKASLSLTDFFSALDFQGFSGLAVATGLEPAVSLRSINFAMVASPRCRLRRFLAQYAVSLHRPLGALNSGAPSM